MRKLIRWTSDLRDRIDLAFNWKLDDAYLQKGEIVKCLACGNGNTIRILDVRLNGDRVEYLCDHGSTAKTPINIYWLDSAVVEPFASITLGARVTHDGNLEYQATEPASATINTASIIKAIRAGDLDEADTRFSDASSQHGLHTVLRAVAEEVEPRPGTITVGHASMVFGNPRRDGYAWGCGTCLSAWRTGIGQPAVRLNYRRLLDARCGATRHATVHHTGDITVQEVS